MYFEKVGKGNTESVADCVAEYLQDNKLEHLVLASVTGYTAELFAERFSKDLQITVVTHVIGMLENGVDEMSQEMRSKLSKQGLKIVTTTHALSGVERAIIGNFGGMYPMELMAHTLRMFGAGVKVGVECACMAMDNGAIPYGQDIISVGGTIRGADTAIVMRPAHSARIFETQIKEILCKPKNFTAQIKKAVD